jgi:hypothetical protein
MSLVMSHVSEGTSMFVMHDTRHDGEKSTMKAYSRLIQHELLVPHAMHES